jgi:phosphomevalonate kinase
MRAAADMFRAGCRTADASLLLLSVRAAASLLARLGALTGISVFNAELRRACRVAGQVAGSAAKPSGAGGGDCAIAILPRALRAELRARWLQAGLEPLAVDLDPCGARCEVMA